MKSNTLPVKVFAFGCANHVICNAQGIAVRLVSGIKLTSGNCAVFFMRNQHRVLLEKGVHKWRHNGPDL